MVRCICSTDVGASSDSHGQLRILKRASANCLGLPGNIDYFSQSQESAGTMPIVTCIILSTLTGKPIEKRPLGRWSNCRWEYNIRKYLKETGMNTRNRVYWRALVNVALCIWGSEAMELGNRFVEGLF